MNLSHLTGEGRAARGTVEVGARRGGLPLPVRSRRGVVRIATRRRIAGRRLALPLGLALGLALGLSLRPSLSATV
ncbi:hypothetical protein, partial [Azospirillum isscasi]